MGEHNTHKLGQDRPPSTNQHQTVLDTLNTFVITLTNKQTNKEVNTQTEIKENKKKNRYINSKHIQTNIQIICIRYEHNATRKQNLLKNTKHKSTPNCAGHTE